MQFSTLALAAFASLASAQSQGGPRVTKVSVGLNGTQRFSPEKITANPGEFVQFQFMSGNHTVTQSTFDAPCQPIAMHSNITGFHSGFQPVAASMAMGQIPIYTIQINNSNPIWLYCAQGRHCENGMSMVINENTATNSTKSIENYKAGAAQANTVVPGGNGLGSAGNGGIGGNTGGTTDAPGPGSTQAAGAGMLSAPALTMLLAAAGFAVLL